MKRIVLVMLVNFSMSGVCMAQIYKYDNNHQVTEIKYDNGVIIAIQYDANGNRINYTTSAGGPLPITLLSFNAQKSVEQVLLTWTTSEEINTDKFEVEHSKEGTTFTSFTTVPASGNSSARKDYSTIHCCPVEGVNYYRLKMIDRDGRSKYSEIKRVVFESANMMKLYPNPASNKSSLSISFTKPFAKDANIAIYSTDGALIYGSILGKGETVVQVNTGIFAAGSYYVVVFVSGELYKEKFIKQ